MTEDTPRGRFVWFELLTSDPEAAPGFYSRVRVGERLRFLGRRRTMWTSDGVPLGGMMKLPPDTKSPPHWLAHISTPNVKGTVEQAVDLRAHMLGLPTDTQPWLGRRS